MENKLINECAKMIKASDKKKYWVHIKEDGKVIGIETRKYMVYWFDVRENGMLLFKYAYNTNTGQYREGTRMGTNFINKMIY